MFFTDIYFFIYYSINSFCTQAEVAILEGLHSRVDKVLSMV